jgi:hypothetical protein
MTVGNTVIYGLQTLKMFNSNKFHDLYVVHLNIFFFWDWVRRFNQYLKGVHGVKKVMNQCFEETEWKMSIGFIWLRKEPVAGCCEHSN